MGQHRTVIRGSLTISAEVLPVEAPSFLTGPRPDDWATDYPTAGSSLALAGLRECVHEGRWAPGFGMYTVRPIGGQICGGWAFRGAPDEEGRVEISYGLAPSGRGGLMTDAVRAAINWASQQSSVRYVWAGVDHDNGPSVRVLERAGLVRIGDADGSRRYEITVGSDQHQ